MNPTLSEFERPSSFVTGIKSLQLLSRKRKRIITNFSTQDLGLAESRLGSSGERSTHRNLFNESERHSKL